MAGRRESQWRERIDDVGVKSLIKLLFAAVALLLFLVFVSILPGVDRVVPGLPITVGAIISAVVTLAVVSLLVIVAGRARALILEFRTKWPEIAIESATVVYWTILFFAVVIAYEGFRAGVEPIAVEAGILWFYDLAFLLLAVGPLLAVGYHLFQLLDPLAEACLAKLRSEAATTGSSTVQTTLPLDGGLDESDCPGEKP